MNDSTVTETPHGERSGREFFLDRRHIAHLKRERKRKPRNSLKWRAWFSAFPFLARQAGLFSSSKILYPSMILVFLQDSNGVPFGGRVWGWGCLSLSVFLFLLFPPFPRQNQRGAQLDCEERESSVGRGGQTATHSSGKRGKSTQLFWVAAEYILAVEAARETMCFSLLVLYQVSQSILHGYSILLQRNKRFLLCL